MSETHYHIKWEIEPHINGGVRIYVSDNSDHFDRTNPVNTATVKANFVGFDLPPANKRQYFLVCFSDKYECVTAPKKVLFNRVENFRDSGGYQSSNSQHIIWGPMFRSGNIAIADCRHLE